MIPGYHHLHAKPPESGTTLYFDNCVSQVKKLCILSLNGDTDFPLLAVAFSEINVPFGHTLGKKK